MNKILIVDDKESETLKTLLGERIQNVNFVPVDSTEKAISLLANENYDGAIVDLHFKITESLFSSALDNYSGRDVIVECNSKGIPVIVYSIIGYKKIKKELSKLGVVSVIIKGQPDSIPRLIGRVQDLFINTLSADEESVFQKKVEKVGLVGTSRLIKELLITIKKVAKSDTNVFILGESGAGKELVAELLHEASNRADGPFITQVIVGDRAPEIEEAELFGVVANYAGFHKQDAQRGKFDLANGGTLFLDEIADISWSVQTKLLRVLQEKEFWPLGAPTPKLFDGRLIFATNSDLPRKIEDRKFREDLYYRLIETMLNVPPLREHNEDIPLLVACFVQQYAEENRIPYCNFHFPEVVIDVIKKQYWPANIRGLETVIRQLLRQHSEKLTNLDFITKYLSNHPLANKPLPYRAPEIQGKSSTLQQGPDQEDVFSVFKSLIQKTDSNVNRLDIRILDVMSDDSLSEIKEILKKIIDRPASKSSKKHQMGMRTDPVVWLIGVVKKMTRLQQLSLEEFSLKCLIEIYFTLGTDKVTMNKLELPSWKQKLCQEVDKKIAAGELKRLSSVQLQEIMKILTAHKRQTSGDKFAKKMDNVVNVEINCRYNNSEIQGKAF